jgi:hypothetical protein
MPADNVEGTSIDVYWFVNDELAQFGCNKAKIATVTVSVRREGQAGSGVYGLRERPCWVGGAGVRVREDGVRWYACAVGRDAAGRPVAAAEREIGPFPVWLTHTVSTAKSLDINLVTSKTSCP